MKPLLYCSTLSICLLILAVSLSRPTAAADPEDGASPASRDLAANPVALAQQDQEEDKDDEDDRDEAEDADAEADDDDEGEDEGDVEDEDEDVDEPDAEDDEQQDEKDEASDDRAAADKADETKSDANADKPLELDGVFQPVHSDTIRIQLEEWSQLSVAEAVEHGAKVQAGDVLIRLETDKLEQAIEDAENEISTDELAVKDGEVKLELARRSQELALRAAEAADRIAAEELKEFVANGRQQRLKSLERSLVNAQNRLEYQAEELKQLERMYEADDLTEETEEIILKRTRDAVESARYSLEVIQNSRRVGIEFEVPRQEEQLERSVAQAALALEEARRTAPQSLERQRLQLEKQKRDLQRKKERLGRLRTDLKSMTVTAPRSGVVYYGTQRRGKWTDPASIESTLQPGGTPKAKSDLLTVVQLRPMTIRVSVPEKAMQQVKPGIKATVKAVAFADLSLPAHVTERSAIPLASGQFEATLELDEAAEVPAELVPGMNAKVTFEAASAESEDDDD